MKRKELRVCIHSVPIETTQALHVLRSQATTLELIRNLCFQRDRLRLASDHGIGVSRFSLCAMPHFRVGRGDCAERATVKPSFFSVSLDQPLAQAHPMNSHVAVESFANGATRQFLSNVTA